MNTLNLGEVKKIILGGGCFWCLDPIFQKVPGVRKVRVGFSGGTEKNPSYREVAYGKTSHAEVIEVTYDPGIITLEKLLELFFTMHDPTTLNQQGADKGTQYRSIILSEYPEDIVVIKKIIEQLNRSGLYNSPVVTQVEILDAFYPAEEYHQDYFNKNPQQAYCQIVIAPKMEKFEHLKIFSPKKDS